MKIAIQGCGHGNLLNIYKRLAQLEVEKKVKVDLLIICGDFQAIRHQRDLQTLACPPKYKKLGDFHHYYTGELTAPVLTLFIGGNHEASAHMWELYHGGWVAPNMYFMGFSSVLCFGGLRIAGISGIYDPRDYKKGYYERLPYDRSSLYSIYHTREFEVEKLKLISSPIDIFVSHEWPLGIYHHGDLAGLLKCKPFFKGDIINGAGIGAKPLADLLTQLKPKRWFSAHMHVEFEAEVKHSDQSTTKFLALDKCLPGRGHLRILDMESTTDSKVLEYDPEWLRIVRAMNPFMNFTPADTAIPRNVSLPDKFINDIPDLSVPTEFSKPSHLPGHRTTISQTKQFCRLLQITDYWNNATTQIASDRLDPNEIKIK